MRNTRFSPLRSLDGQREDVSGSDRPYSERHVGYSEQTNSACFSSGRLPGQCDLVFGSHSIWDSMLSGAGSATYALRIGWPKERAELKVVQYGSLSRTNYCYPGPKCSSSQSREKLEVHLVPWQAPVPKYYGVDVVYSKFQGGRLESGDAKHLPMVRGNFAPNTQNMCWQA